MPTHIRAMCQWQIGSSLPRDVMQITPCFRHADVLGLTDPVWDELANDLATGLQTWDQLTTQLTVKLYQIGLPKPNRPKATVIKSPGVIPSDVYPREIAICLSFNGGPNAPRNRGRVYAPAVLANPLASDLGPRPNAQQRAKVAELAPLFENLGGVETDWIVWSPSNTAATAVERWFVDDEWDMQRRRGLRSTTRTSGTTSEA